MKAEDVLNYFDGNKAAACRAVGIRRQNFAYWEEHGIPLLQQYRLQEVTNGELCVDRSDINKKQERRDERRNE